MKKLLLLTCCSTILQAGWFTDIGKLIYGALFEHSHEAGLLAHDAKNSTFFDLAEEQMALAVYEHDIQKKVDEYPKKKWQELHDFYEKQLADKTLYNQSPDKFGRKRSESTLAPRKMYGFFGIQQEKGISMTVGKLQQRMRDYIDTWENHISDDEFNYLVLNKKIYELVAQTNNQKKQFDAYLQQGKALYAWCCEQSDFKKITAKLAEVKKRQKHMEKKLKEFR